jgi:hypothetical protein
MSHITRVQAEFKDFLLLNRACDILGGEIVGKEYIAGRGRERIRCDYAIRIKGVEQGREIGVTKTEDDTFSLSYGIMNRQLRTLFGENCELIEKEYAVQSTLSELSLIGFACMEQTINSEGETVLTMMR